MFTPIVGCGPLFQAGIYTMSVTYGGVAIPLLDIMLAKVDAAAAYSGLLCMVVGHKYPPSYVRWQHHITRNANHQNAK